MTGATGYLGGRLIPMLLERGYKVRCLARAPEKLGARPWRDHPGIEVVQGDVDDTDALAEHLAGCASAYYLIHSMESASGDFAHRDAQLARSFAQAAERAGIQRIIYMGGLGEMGEDLSEHLRSRREVEEVLAAGPVPVTTLRAAMIIGSGSASFEILRYLVERLPAMITPRWVRTESQPIAVRDVLHYLIAALETPETAGDAIDIGGPDVHTYKELMRIMAEELELPRRLIVPVPVLTPRLSSLWIGLVTPVTSRIGRPLAEGLRNRVVVTNDTADRLLPHKPVDARTAIRTALGKTKSNSVETRWSSAGPISGDPDWAGGTVFNDTRRIGINATPAAVFRAVCRVGGGHGWYAADTLWRIRGWMDQLVGGPGLRRGRRHTENVEYGEALDFWRVISVQKDRSLLLRAEMKLPGVATLGFEIDPPPTDQDEARPAASPNHETTDLQMTARFRPKGLLGLAYWYAVLPLHGFVFRGMLNGIKRAAEQIEAEPAKP